MVVNNNKPMKKLVSRELFIFQKYNVDAKDIHALLKCGRNMKPRSQPLVRQILRIVDSQIEIEEFFFFCLHIN